MQLKLGVLIQSGAECLSSAVTTANIDVEKLAAPNALTPQHLSQKVCSMHVPPAFPSTTATCSHAAYHSCSSNMWVGGLYQNPMVSPGLGMAYDAQIKSPQERSLLLLAKRSQSTLANVQNWN